MKTKAIASTVLASLSLLLCHSPLAASGDFPPKSGAPISNSDKYATDFGYPRIGLHYVNSLNINFEMVEIEDGSNWVIDLESAADVALWKISDPLVISPNYRWCSSYIYKITNLRTGASVKANPKFVPVPFGPYSHWVVKAMPKDYLLVLENGLTCRIAGSSLDNFLKWGENDTVIIGVSNACCSAYNLILINSSVNNFVYARVE